MIAEFPAYEEIVGMFMLTPESDLDAPAIAENLTLHFDNGSNSGTLNFKAPVLTYGGSELSGELSYTILVNEEVAATGNVNAGAEASVSLTVTDGMNTFTVILANEKGESPVTMITAFIGMDTPLPVTNLLFETTDPENQISLTWDAPVIGINDGYVDVANLTYKIVRFPGNVVVIDEYS